MALLPRLREYYRLSKPGIVYGNAMTTIAAFLYATRWQFAPVLFLSTLLGIALVIASACVFNNYMDRHIDRQMERTRKRPLVIGTISARAALIYGIALGLLGLALLALRVNLLTAGIAFFGWVMYVLVYGWAKRTGWWGAMVGTVPGAVPIVVGYTAVMDRMDVPVLLLFLVMVAWQLPHFYGIAMFRKEEYAAAGIPALPEAKGARTAKAQSLFFMVAFLIFAPLLSVLGYAGLAYRVIVIVAGAVWLWRAVRGLRIKTDAAWGREVFMSSLFVLLTFSVALAAAPLLT